MSFTLPEQGSLLEDILFIELCREEAQKLLTGYKEEAKRLLPTPAKRKRHKKRPHKHHSDAHGEENAQDRMTMMIIMMRVEPRTFVLVVKYTQMVQNQHLLSHN